MSSNSIKLFGNNSSTLVAPIFKFEMKRQSLLKLLLLEPRLCSRYYSSSAVLIVAVVASLSALHGVHSVTLEKDLSLNRDEKLALQKFRMDVTDILPESYMNEDIYLIRWLRAKKFNLPEAKAMLVENLKWRKANNMSTIHQEDWSDLMEDYPFFLDTFDKEGRPVVTLRFGEWNIRRAVVTSHGPRLTRYLYKSLDEVTGKVRELQQQGKQVTQWTALLDMDGYNFVNHGCIQCLYVYLNYVTAYESYFPGSQHDIILINTPSIFETVIGITRPLIRESTRNILHVFGTNQKQWQAYLLQHIDANQLEPQVGGTRIRP